MKKTTNQKSRPFRNLVSRMFGIACTLALACAVTSCSVQNSIGKDDFRKFPKDITVRFYDKADTLHYNYDNMMYTRSFTKGFAKMDNIDYSKPIQLTIKGKAMYLKFEDSYAKQHVLKFYGKRHQKKFVFYTNYQTVSFPILFIKKEMTKFSVYLSDENEILFEDHHVSEGMFLFFGAGSSSKSDYKFKILRDE